MRTPDLNSLTNEQLAQRFCDLSIEQFDAGRGNELKRVIRLARAIIAIAGVLESRGADALRILLPLLNHQNAQVRLDAATVLKPVERERATATLKVLSEWGPSAQRGAAGMSLYYDEKGISKASRLWRKAQTPE
jgi:hypothetical protein